MHGPNQIIPRMPRCQLTKPILMARNIIHLQRQLNRKTGVVPPRLFDFGDILIELVLSHVPIIEIIAVHRVVVGKSNFLEAKLHRLRGQLGRFAYRVPAERGMHVIISRQRHGAIKT